MLFHIYFRPSYTHTTLAGCLRVDQAHLVYKEMRDSLQQLVLSTDLHLLFLATPLDLGTSIQPNWMVYFQEVCIRIGPSLIMPLDCYSTCSQRLLLKNHHTIPSWQVTGLGEDELRTAEQLGVKPGYLAGKATGAARGSVVSLRPY